MKEDLSLLSLYLLFDGRENWLLTGFSACAFGNSNANSISIKDFLSHPLLDGVGGRMPSD